MKETLAVENDRNVASPTESAACGNQRREHSGADVLKAVVSVGAYVIRALSVKRG